MNDVAPSWGVATEKPKSFGSRAEWSGWLESNHETASEAWVLFYKKHVNANRLEYPEAVEEAICWGWIDGKLKSIDGRTHMIRFTPRRPGSIWSITNRRRAEKMIREGRMREHGLESVRVAKRNGQWAAAYVLSRAPKVPADLQKALQNNGASWDHFSQLSNSGKTAFVYHVESAKRADTRSKRIREVVRRTSISKAKKGVNEKRAKTSR